MFESGLGRDYGFGTGHSDIEYYSLQNPTWPLGFLAEVEVFGGSELYCN